MYRLLYALLTAVTILVNTQIEIREKYSSLAYLLRCEMIAKMSEHAYQQLHLCNISWMKLRVPAVRHLSQIQTLKSCEIILVTCGG